MTLPANVVLVKTAIKSHVRRGLIEYWRSGPVRQVDNGVKRS